MVNKNIVPDCIMVRDVLLPVVMAAVIVSGMFGSLVVASQIVPDVFLIPVAVVIAAAVMLAMLVVPVAWIVVRERVMEVLRRGSQ